MVRKTNVEDIDPNELINSFRQDDMTIPPAARAMGTSVKKPGQSVENEDERMETPVTPAPAETAKNEPERRRKMNKPDYEEAFVHEARVTARQGKQVYIRKEYHDRILRIIQVIGKNELSIASYLDNVLAQHFNDFLNDIEESFEKHIQSYKSVMK